MPGVQRPADRLPAGRCRFRTQPSMLDCFVMADDPFDQHLDEPTPEQLEAASHAGWSVGQPGDEGYPIAPPAGWDAHALDPGPVAFLEASDLVGEDDD